MTARPPSETVTGYTWTEIEADEPKAGIVRQRIMGERTLVCRMVAKEGFHADPHVHHNEQIVIVVEGRVRFRIGEIGSDSFRDETIGPGQVMYLPPNVPHGATALEPSVLYEMFSPPSEKTGLDQG
jgi:quercetin dioxygenase-like cupin family protein